MDRNNEIFYDWFGVVVGVSLVDEVSLVVGESLLVKWSKCRGIRSVGNTRRLTMGIQRLTRN